MALTYDINKDAFYKTGLEKGREQGRAQGLEQGIVQGLEQGIVQGLEQGEKKGIAQEKNAMVIGLLKSDKLSWQEIANVARISVEQVQQIAEQNL